MSHLEISLKAIGEACMLSVSARGPVVGDHVRQSVRSLHLPRLLQDPVNPLRALVVHTAPADRFSELLHTIIATQSPLDRILTVNIAQGNLGISHR